ncbi:unnamed protein product, partial [Hymenolepis diminuta]
DAYVVVKPPWIDIVANGGKRRSYVFQQDSAPLHKALKARVWMDRQEFSSTCHTTPNLARRGEGRRGEARGGRGEARGGKERLGVVEKEVTKRSHNTKSSSLKGAIARGMEEMNKDHRMKAFSQSLLDLNWRASLSFFVAAFGGLELTKFDFSITVLQIYVQFMIDF